MRVSTMTVYRLIRDGELPAIRVGKHFRLRVADVDRFLSARTVNPSSNEVPSAPEAGGESIMRVLLAAAQRSTVTRLVDAVEEGGLLVESVELIPLALIRALAAPEVPLAPPPPPLDDNIPGEAVAEPGAE